MAVTIKVYPQLSPRLIMVNALDDVGQPATEITVQKIVNLCREWEDDPWNMSYPKLISAAGKEDLGGGVSVGITATLENAKLMFEMRPDPLYEGSTVTTGDTDGLVLTDTGETFVTDDTLYLGCTIFNSTDGSMAPLTEIIGETQLRHLKLDGGSNNYWTLGDSYIVYPNVQCSISGGNLVAVDADGASIESVHPSPNVQILRTSSSSATLQELSSIQFSSFGSGVTIDTVNGVAGTTFPTGTGEQPVNNLADAKTIATTRGFIHLYVVGSLTIGASDNIDAYHIDGFGQEFSTLVLTSGCSTEGANFERLSISGAQNGETHYERCEINALSNVHCEFHHCKMVGPITSHPTAQDTILMHNCFGGGTTGTYAIFDMNDGPMNVNFSGYSGLVTIRNMTDALSDMDIDCISAKVELESSCTAGNIHVRGVGVLIDNSAGSTVDRTGFTNPAFVTDSVWDETLSDHTTVGTYGEELATKADIAASVSTVETYALSGTAVQGTVASGTYASLSSKDNTYWQITEDATNGIQVDMTFNLPNSDCKAGSINVFGRYTGQPGLTHYQELWAYNYESASWELLVEEFMPGGNTSDDTYSHEYSERHIDRTSSNEVQIRLLHNTSTYNASHNLYLDYVDVSCVEVVTAADIADAVWDEASADHLVVGSTGKALSDAGVAGNPWSAVAADNNVAGTMGEYMNKIKKWVSWLRSLF